MTASSRAAREQQSRGWEAESGAPAPKMSPGEGPLRPQACQASVVPPAHAHRESGCSHLREPRAVQLPSAWATSRLSVPKTQLILPWKSLVPHHKNQFLRK